MMKDDVELRLGGPLEAFIGFGQNVLVRRETNMQRGAIGAGGTWRGIIRLGKLGDIHNNYGVNGLGCMYKAKTFGDQRGG